MIYIVEDDLNIRQMESYALRNSGLEVMEFGDGSSFFQACEKRLPKLVILDIMLPEEDGLSILKSLKARYGSEAPAVILVTAKDNEIDKVTGLDCGADDYIAKPFGIMEFIARVKAVLRRTESKKEGMPDLIRGSIVLSDAKRTVLVDGVEANLTFKEFELLKLLLEHSGKVLSRQQIMDRVWDTDFYGESRTVDMHVKTLRKKLGSQGERIKTVRNIGYKLEV